MTHGVFGITDVDQAMDAIEQRHPRKVEPKPLRPSALPKMSVTRSVLPKATAGIDFANVVNVPEALLREVVSKIDGNTDKLNALLLKRLLPMLLSYETSTGYAKAALKEGLDVEIAFDQGLADCVKHIGYLNVVMHFIRGSALPRSVKQRFMRQFSDQLATQAVTQLVESNKTQLKTQQLQELQAVVYARQANKTTVHSQAPEDEEPKPQTSALRRRRGRT